MIGEASLVLESERQNVQYEGHFGGTFPGRAMDPEIMAETARLLFPVARQHGMTEILITTRKGDKMVEKACELLEAKPLDFLQVQQPYTKKRIDIRRFVVDL
ncbi:MAG: hypothetical protein FPO08_00590 [Geobacter sp.]|nr:MAG: hypothetical protein FPO08_00590 [Geobacter sp.]